MTYDSSQTESLASIASDLDSIEHSLRTMQINTARDSIYHSRQIAKSFGKDDSYEVWEVCYDEVLKVLVDAEVTSSARLGVIIKRSGLDKQTVKIVLAGMQIAGLVVCADGGTVRYYFLKGTSSHVVTRQ